MEKFAALVDQLVYTRSRNEKVRVIAAYLRETSDPDRGWALAALTDCLSFSAVKGGTIRSLMMDRVDPVLWALSRDFVGDTAETASLLWPAPRGDVATPPSVGEAVDRLSKMTRASVMSELPRLFDRLSPEGRYALIKLATGAMRVGVSARLAKTAFAQAFEVAVEDVEEYWHALSRRFAAVRAGGRLANPPDTRNRPLFRPFCRPRAETRCSPHRLRREWKWDCLRNKLVNGAGRTGSIRARATM